MKRAILLLVWVLCGCASELSQQSRDLLKQGTDFALTRDRGILFGEECGGGAIEFRAKSFEGSALTSGGILPSYKWLSDQRKLFIISLPAGEYQIPYLETFEGHTLDLKPAYRVVVSPGKATYIGALYPSWFFHATRDEEKACRSEWRRAIMTLCARKINMIGSNECWDVYVLDRASVAVDGLKEAFPNVDLSNYASGIPK